MPRQREQLKIKVLEQQMVCQIGALLGINLVQDIRYSRLESPSGMPFITPAMLSALVYGYVPVPEGLSVYDKRKWLLRQCETKFPMPPLLSSTDSSLYCLDNHVKVLKNIRHAIALLPQMVKQQAGSERELAHLYKKAIRLYTARLQEVVSVVSQSGRGNHQAEAMRILSEYMFDNTPLLVCKEVSDRRLANLNELLYPTFRSIFKKMLSVTTLAALQSSAVQGAAYSPELFFHDLDTALFCHSNVSKALLPHRLDMQQIALYAWAENVKNSKSSEPGSKCLEDHLWRICRKMRIFAKKHADNNVGILYAHWLKEVDRMLRLRPADAVNASEDDIQE